MIIVKFNNGNKVSFFLARCKGDSILEYTHANLHGLEEIPSMCGVRYILFIVNDYSRKL